MLSKHLFTVLSVIFAIALVPAIAVADTVTWDAGGDGINWHDEDNWDPNQVPTEDDVVVIFADFKVIVQVVIQTYQQEDNAACKTLDLSLGGANLHIKGVTLTLGEVDTPTTSTLDGAITFESVGEA